MTRTLSRRTLLRGIGVTAGLPFLECMRAKGASSRELPKLAMVYSPNGMYMPAWTPAGPSGELDVSPTLQPLNALREHCTVITGLRVDPEMEAASRAGPHSLACSGFLSGVAPLRSEGALQAGVSVDQLAAQACKDDSWFPSLEFALEEPVAASDREPGYSTAYLNHVSWRTPSLPMPADTDPRAAFQRLFRGDAGHWIKNSYAGSFLDRLLPDASDLSRQLGASDRTRLAQYLGLLRDAERQVQNVDALSRRERDFLMMDLVALALQSGVTRVASVMLGREKSHRTFPDLDIAETHHQLSHRNREESNVQKLQAIDRYHTECFGRVAVALASLETSSGSLLDSCLLLYGSGMSDAAEHRHNDLPVVLVGSRAGNLAGRHIRLARETDLRLFYSAVLHWFSSRTPSSIGVDF